MSSQCSELPGRRFRNVKQKSHGGTCYDRPGHHESKDGGDTNGAQVP